jgi:5-hydroxyisourate hydrolase
MANLSTHVLDMSTGCPAAHIRIDLYRITSSVREHLKRMTANADGRTTEPLLAGERIESGVYELVFQAGQYYRDSGQTLSEPAFLDEVVVRFGIANEEGRYHVPLLLSPYGYSTYRGS